MLAADLLADFHRKITDSPADFEAELTGLFLQPLLQEAIYLASPALHAAFLTALQNEGKAADKNLATLYKYLIRMCTRATSYGLFAGFTTGRFSDYTAINFNETRPFSRFTRLDGAIAGDIADYYKKQDHILNQVLFYPSSSLYTIGDTVRFVERINSPEGPKNLLSGILVDPMLKKILAASVKGASLKQLITVLSAQTTKAHAKQYLMALIQMQVIVSELDVNVTGQPYLLALEGKLKNIPATGKQIHYLKQIQKLLKKPVTAEHTHKQWSDLLLKAGVALHDKTPVHTDVCFNTTDCQIKRQSIEILTQEFANISYLYQADHEDTDLAEFKKSFFQKYENRQVPLLEALDCENGIGYGPLIPGHSELLELVENISFPASKPAPALPTALSRLKAKLASRAAPEKMLPVLLTDHELAEFKSEIQSSEQIADSYLYWLGSFITRSAKALDKGDFRFLLKSIGGASGLELMGRFCHADPLLAAQLQNAASAQQAKYPGVIYAEIAHLPQARTANILARPHLRQYEIVYLAAGNLPRHRQIPANDLMISVPDGKEILIISKRLKKRVQPCMATAHNFTRGLPVYRFLADVSRQQNPQFTDWHWEEHDQQVTLPRIEYGHFVISRARWNIKEKAFPFLFKKNSSFQINWPAAAAQLSIPRYFQVCHGDQELLIDSACPRALKLLGEMFTAKKSKRLVEWLDSADFGLIRDQAGTYSHELVIPFLQKSATKVQVADPSLPQKPSSDKEQTNFWVGSCWLYVRIYCGTKTAERILTDQLHDLLEDLTQTGIVEKWFYIRYQDNLPHIRIRFYHSTRPDFWYTVLSKLSSLLGPLTLSGLISSLQTDIYKRETERYWGLSFPALESIFYFDSCAALQILRQLKTKEDPETERWLTGIYGADRLMDALGIQLAEKVSIIQKLYASFFAEFKGNKDLTIQLNDQYRKHKAVISRFMQEPGPVCEQIFKQRSACIQTILSGSQVMMLRRYCEHAPSFIHLFLNRLFVSDHRRQELVIYHYLNKYYNTLINKGKKSKTKE